MLIQEKELSIRSSSKKSQVSVAGQLNSNKYSVRRNRFSCLLGCIIITVTSFLFCALFNFKVSAMSALNSEFSQFRWLVLVNGEQLQIDEVGRFLRQMNNVDQAKFISADEALERLKTSSPRKNSFDNIDPKFLPASWEVSWKNIEEVSESEFLSNLDELSNYPGVASVSFDVKSWTHIQSLFKLHSETRAILSLLMVLATLFTVLFYGFILFYYKQEKPTRRTLFLTVFPAILSWLAGYYLVQGVLGPLPWPLLSGGLVLGFSWMLWEGRV